MATKKRPTKSRAASKTSPRKKASKKTASKKTASKKTASKKTSSTKSARKKRGGPKYGAAATKKVGRAVHEQKRGKLRSGRSNKKVASRKQAIAIGLSQARARGAKVPKKKKSSR